MTAARALPAQPPDPPPSPYMTADDVAALFHVTRRTVTALAARGEIPSFRIGRLIRFRREDVQALATPKPPTP
jgi:excisionase family DNA binding protein